MSSGSWQGWQSWGASSGCWDEQKWESTDWKNAENDHTDIMKMEGRDGILEVTVNGSTEPNFRKAHAWNEDEESMTGLVFSREGKHYCARVELRETVPEALCGRKNPEAILTQGGNLHRQLSSRTVELALWEAVEASSTSESWSMLRMSLS